MEFLLSVLWYSLWWTLNLSFTLYEAVEENSVVKGQKAFAFKSYSLYDSRGERWKEKLVPRSPQTDNF